MKRFSFIISIFITLVCNCYSQTDYNDNENIALVAKNIIERLDIITGNELVLINSSNKTKIVDYLKTECQARIMYPIFRAGFNQS